MQLVLNNAKRKVIELDGDIPKFGLLTDPIEGVVEQILRFKKLGFDFTEIGIEEPKATPQALMSQKNLIINSLRETEMFAIGHTAYWVQFGSSHLKARRGWVEEGKDMVKVASELRIQYLNFHFYGRLGRVGATREFALGFVENFTNSITELTEFAAEKKVELMLENVPSQDGGVADFRNFSAVMEKVPKLMFHFDIAHAYIENRMAGIRSYLDAFSDRLVHIHIHDNHGEEDEHLPLGWGKIDFRKVVRWLKELNYDKTITFEVFTSNQDAVRSREYFRKLWNKTKV
ncbi:MAG TPA: sugar phosphate isomerase/epimerase [Candidatus Bathyarchaeia archaeon]|nr:sugar phosphate isomerase/epimerase [Candidatus Bathyarchaeia archaeon]